MRLWPQGGLASLNPYTDREDARSTGPGSWSRNRASPARLSSTASTWWSRFPSTRSTWSRKGI